MVRFLLQELVVLRLGEEANELRHRCFAHGWSAFLEFGIIIRGQRLLHHTPHGFVLDELVKAAFMRSTGPWKTSALKPISRAQSMISAGFAMDTQPLRQTVGSAASSDSADRLTSAITKQHTTLRISDPPARLHYQ